MNAVSAIRMLWMNSDSGDSSLSALPWHYSFAETPFGEVLVASTQQGVCFLGFTDGDRPKAMADMRSRFPHALFREETDELQRAALSLCRSGKRSEAEMEQTASPVVLHLKATPFQWKVWNALLEIPSGQTVTYRDIALSVASSKACRAVGSAVGRNPVSLLIPCHRVVRGDGGMGGYHWGIARKQALLEWESGLCETSIT